MADYTQILNVMKKAGVNATDASKPVNVCFGKVISTAPLKILVEQKITLGAAQLVLTRNVTDYELNVSVDWGTEATSDHAHGLSGQNKMKVHNSLAEGEKVLLIRVQGGQKYVVIDRVV